MLIIIRRRPACRLFTRTNAKIIGFNLNVSFNILY